MINGLAYPVLAIQVAVLTSGPAYSLVVGAPTCIFFDFCAVVVSIYRSAGGFSIAVMR